MRRIGDSSRAPGFGRVRHERLRVLVVEDHASDGRFARECLSERDDVAFDVHVVERLALAIRAAREDPWDVVVLDLGLPDSWGLETFRQFRRAIPQVPVVVLTGLADSDVGLNALREGAQDYIVKGSFDGALLRRAALYAVERWRLEERLRVAEKMEAVGTLAGGIAHDFNNLLTSILGYEDLARTALPEDSPVRADLDEIRKAAQSAAVLTRQLLAFSRKEPRRHDPLNVNDVLSRLEGFLRRVLPENIALRMAAGAELESTRADAVEIQQVVINLAVNARDAMASGGTLTIATANTEVTEAGGAVPPGRYVRLSVSDTGCGMDARTQSRLFEPFFTTKARERGTGLGLATVLAIVTDCGGTITVESEVDRGTTITVYLPATSTRAHLPAAPVASPARGTERVLLVEDDAPIRDLAARVLRGLGYEVVQASNGHDALALALADPSAIDLIVTDVIMPGVGGTELAERFRQSRPDVPVLFVSGYTGGGVPDFTSGGRSGFLPKPFTAESLAGAIRELLDGRAGTADYGRG